MRAGVSECVRACLCLRLCVFVRASDCARARARACDCAACVPVIVRAWCVRRVRSCTAVSCANCEPQLPQARSLDVSHCERIGEAGVGCLVRLRLLETLRLKALPRFDLAALQPMLCCSAALCVRCAQLVTPACACAPAASSDYARTRGATARHAGKGEREARSRLARTG